MAKRYVLMKADGDGPKPCAFFASAAGCRNSAGCKFLHGDQPTAGSLAAKAAKGAATANTTPAPPTVAPVPTPAPVEPPPAENGHSATAVEEAERAAKKKAKKKAKKEKEAREAAAAAAAAVAAAAPAPAPAPAPVATPVAPAPPPVVPTPAPPAAALVVASAADPPLSKTKAKKQAFREKAARKAEAAAAAAAANAAAANANAIAVAAAAAAATTTANPPPTPPAAVPATPAVVPNGEAPSPVTAAAAAAGAAAVSSVLPVSKKKKRKNKKKAAQPPAAAATPASAPATAVNPAPVPAPAGPPPPFYHPLPPMSTPLPAAKPAKPTTRVCSFFNKKKGCQTGALCPFLHRGVEGGGFGGTRGHAKPAPAAAVAPAPAAPATPATPKTRKPKPTPPAVPAVTPVPSAVVGAAAAAVSESPSSRRTRKRGRSETPVAAGGAGSGLLDGLPISPFVAPGAAVAAKNEEPLGAAAVPAGIPHPKADIWQGLVERTKAHPKYAKNYRFETDATWIEASPCGDACADLPQVVALDCEMCMSEDPLSKERNGKELLRLSIVRGEDGEKLMDTLVRPSNPVVDWRTDIHGVGPQHMEGVVFTHRHAQVAISRICCKNTVIIGHALNNDLAALRMSHDRVVDTSFLFEGSDKKFSTPSLKDVVRAALGRDIQHGCHDSVTDAKSTLEAARYALDNTGAPLPAVARTKKLGRRSVDGRHRKKARGLVDEDDEEERAAKEDKEARSLMVHRLPAGTTQEQLLKVMQKKTKVVAVEVQPIDFAGATGKTKVVYATKAQADIAFNGIHGNAMEDTSGRLQKRIYTSMDGKKYIAVRHGVVMRDSGHDMEQAAGLPDLSSSSSSSEED
eukprot:g5761.t1